VDNASVALFQAALAGTHFATGRLELLGAGGVVAKTYDLTDVLVASVKLGASPVCPQSLTEDLSFSFATLALAPGT
jgi:type VI protein secretion system component Hcp